MEANVRQIYAFYDNRRRQLEAQESDAEDLRMLEDLERRVRESDDQSRERNE